MMIRMSPPKLIPKRILFLPVASEQDNLAMVWIVPSPHSLLMAGACL